MEFNEKGLPRKILPSLKATIIRKEICAIRQEGGETLYEYWERFKRLCASCPHHQISESLLIQYFYEGLTMRDRSMLDAASGGALVDKTPTEARNLITNMATNSQQFGGDRHDWPIRRVNEVGVNSEIQQQLATLTSLIKTMAMRDN